MEPIVVIGIGPHGQGLSPEALAHIQRAQLLAGGKRHLTYFPDWQGERLAIDADLPGVIRRLKERGREVRCVVLASGDPLFFGIGRKLLESLPRESLVFLPHVSSVQVAFARLKEPWDDACIVSLHGRPIASLLPALQQGQSKIAIFTDPTNHPAAIARYVLDQGHAGAYQVWVGENLGGSEERCTLWPLAGLAGADAAHFAPLNLVVLLKNPSLDCKEVALDAPLRSRLGLPEDLFLHRNGQITRWEIRLLALGALELHTGDVLWDIGAGSGSVGIEAARLCPGLSVWAVEKNAVACRHIEENIGNLAATGLHVVPGEAPAALADLPAPDAVFVGGSGGNLAAILGTVMDRLKPAGRVVLNCVTLDNLNLSWSWFKERHLTPEVTSVQLARSGLLNSGESGYSCLEPEKPIFIVRVRKP